MEGIEPSEVPYERTAEPFGTAMSARSRVRCAALITDADYCQALPNLTVG